MLVALADPTRRQILDMLAEGGSRSATALAQQLPVSRQAVVKHLGVLDHAGLVSAARSGREVRYSVQTGPVQNTVDWLGELTARWNPARPADDDGSPAGGATGGAGPDAQPPSGAVATGVRVAGRLADHAYRLVPRPLTALVPPVLRR